jgi:hypothetical protein
VRIILKSCAFGIFFGWLLFCSCATKSPSSAVLTSDLPAEVSINKEAGRGGNIIVMLRLESGEELPFIVDSGSEGTILDKTLGSRLGKQQGIITLKMVGIKEEANLYAAPKLFLGDVPLLTGSNIATHDFRSQSSILGRPIMGILGMDCLVHYCIQLDFASEKMRFLNAHQIDAAKSGKAFPLKIAEWTRPFIHHASLSGENVDLLVDTGCVFDGVIEEKTKNDSGMVTLPECLWDGEIYTNLFVGTGGNVIGLKFLARHLVTLDFPNRMLYLKQTGIGPLSDEAAESAMNFLRGLKEKDQLPGWSKNDKGITAMPQSDLNSVNVTIGKDGIFYHYVVLRAIQNSPWKLKKAWRTDQNGKILEEFPVSLNLCHYEFKK